MPRTFYRDVYVPPTDKRFRVRIGLNHHLVVWTNVYGVQLEYFTKMNQEQGDWTVWLDYDENPDLKGLFHPVHGWDLVGLARLLWAYVDAAETIQRTSAKDGKVSVPFHLNPGIREWRESQETTLLIHSVLQAANRPLSRKEIAKGLGKSKHPRLNKLIESMVEAGELTRSEEPLQNGKMKYLYSDNADTTE